MKTLNLNGIRKRTILCTIKGIKNIEAVVLQPIDEKQEKELDETEQITIDGNLISRKSIYFYGEVNVYSDEDMNIVDKCSLLNQDDCGNTVYSNFDYDKGTATYETVPKQYPTWNAVLWFKFNHCLIGKPKRCICYKIPKSYL